MTIRLLTENDIININKVLIERYSPSEIKGIKDYAALNMTVNQLNQTVFDEEIYPTLYDKAAILYINLVQKHPFHNGNKRTAYGSMKLFLRINDIFVDMPSKTAVDLTVEIATTNMNIDDLKVYVVNNIKKYIKNK